MQPRVFSKVMLPPTSWSNSHPDPMFWHPEEEALWVFAGRQSIWRVAADGTGEEIFDRFAFAPLELALYETDVKFYYDTARRTPVLTFQTYSDLHIVAIEGRTARLVAQKNTVDHKRSSDSLAFDPRRGVLVHAYLHESQLCLREMGVDGTWVDVGTPVPISTPQTMAGWDERLGLVVVFFNHPCEATGWNGVEWRPLGTCPFSHDGTYQTGRSPSGALVILLGTGGTREARCFELGDGEWHQRDAGRIATFGGFATDPRTHVAFLYGPRYESGVERTLATYDGQRLAPAGKVSSSLHQGSVGGPVRFFSNHGPTPLRFSVDTRELAEAGVLPKCIAYLADCTGEISLTAAGEIHWGDKIIPPPAGFTVREGTNLGSDGKGTLLIVGGVVTWGARPLMDAWCFDGAWTKLEPKGAKPIVEDAHVIYDPSRRVWLVIGGHRKNDSLHVTSELEKNRWTKFESAFVRDGEKKADVPHVDFAARDTTTGEIFCVSASATALVYVYRGGGTWHHVLDVDAYWTGTWAWDDTRRVLVGASGYSVAEIELGGLLDAFPRAKSPLAASPVAKKKSAGATRPKKVLP